MLLEVDVWPLFNTLRVHTAPVDFLKADKDNEESLWSYLAKHFMDSNQSFEYNFQKVVGVLGVRLSFLDERRFFNFFKIGFSIECWFKDTNECFKMKSCYRSKYQKGIRLKVDWSLSYFE